jgi:hypothetical protein
MGKIKSISQKLVDGSFSKPYPIGVDAANVDMADGSTLEEEVKSLNNSISEKAPINHACKEDTYGIGTKIAYGHLKINDFYNQVADEDASSTAVSMAAIVPVSKGGTGKTSITADHVLVGGIIDGVYSERAIQTGSPQEKEDALITSGGVYTAVSEIKTGLNAFYNDLSSAINEVDENSVEWDLFNLYITRLFKISKDNDRKAPVPNESYILTITNELPS